jgi:hypothetical protein
MQRVSISDDESERFGQLAEVFLCCRDAFYDIAGETDWIAAPGSVAQGDHEAIASRTPSCPPEARIAITKTAYFYLVGATEQLGALAALYACHEVVVAPHVLVRGTLEYCSRVVWLLRGPGAEGRLARAYLEHLLSAEEAKKNAGRLLGKGGDQHTREAERFKALKEDVLHIFPEPRRDKYGWLLNGESRPRLEDAVRAMYSSDVHGQGIYGLLSNFSHPTLYTLSRLWGTVREGDEFKIRFQFTLEDHEQRARLAVTSFYTAFGAAVQYHGWPGEVRDTLVSHIDRLLPGAIAPPGNAGQ